MKIDILIHRLNMVYAHAGNIEVFISDSEYGPCEPELKWKDYSGWYYPMGNILGEKRGIPSWHTDEYRGIHL